MTDGEFMAKFCRAIQAAIPSAAEAEARLQKFSRGGGLAGE